MGGIAPERFQQGMTYEQYKRQMTRNQERLEANEKAVRLSSEELAPFQRLQRPLKVAALAEDWCGDVVANLPVLGRLAEETGKLDLRVFLRDQNLDIMDQYLKEGKYRSIPVFVFFDQAFNEIGRFQERPDSVTAELDRRRTELYAKHPEFGEQGQPIDQLPEDVRVRLQQANAQMRSDMAPFSNAEVARELGQIVAKAS